MDRSHEIIKVDGVVIKEADYKEYDKLLTLFTKQLGKINVYAFGVRRPNSKNIGKTRVFTFGNFELKESKGIYELLGSTYKASFDDLSKDYDDICYASYFLELCDYFAYENVEGENVYVLLYYTLKALNDKKLDRDLIKHIYELKMLKYQGLYIESSELKNDKLTYTWDFVLSTLPKKLYSFTLDDYLRKIFFDKVDSEMKEKVNKRFKTI